MNDIKQGYTRISDILEQWGFWIRLAPEVREKAREKADKVGTPVHEAIDLWSQGIEVPLDEKCQGYFESFLKWQKEVGLQTIHKPARLYDDKLKITGEIDCIGYIKDEPVLIDFKTEAKPFPEKWELQGGFYKMLLHTNEIKTEQEFIFVHLQKDGSIAKSYTFDFSTDLIEICLYALFLYRRFEKRLGKNDKDV